MKEYQQRQEAVDRYFKGEKVTHIACSLSKSRKWVHDWIKRFNNRTGNDDWFKDESKAPIKQAPLCLQKPSIKFFLSARN